MKSREPSVRSALMVSVLTGALGFTNGVWVVLTGTSYFRELSPYTLIFQAFFRVIPLQFVEDAYYFLFRSEVQLILAPLLGALLGAVIGYVASRINAIFAKSSLMVNGPISGGIGGFLSLGIIFLNVYAS